MSTQTTTDIRPLETEEVNQVSGGLIYIPVVVGAFALGTGIRMGISWIAKKLF